MALASAALLCLLIALCFPFIGVEIAGQTQQLPLIHTATTLALTQQPLVAIIVGLAIIVLPALYLIGVILMQTERSNAPVSGFKRTMARYFAAMHPWMMADVFVVAVLVSLIKLVGLAEIVIGPAFWAYSAFAVLLLMTTRSIDIDYLWRRLAGEPNPPRQLHAGETALAQGMVNCLCCGAIHALPSPQATQTAHLCSRCGQPLHPRIPLSQQHTWALLCAAAVLYVPANLYPMMITTAFGQTHTNTLMSGMIELWHQGSQPIAVVIFIASILVPSIKMLVLALLNWRIRHPEQGSNLSLYHWTEFVGRWSMVDVFVVAILVGLIQSGQLMSVLPGPAALAFCSVVILTMLAAMRFDPRQLWSVPYSHENA